MQPDCGVHKQRGKPSPQISLFQAYPCVLLTCGFQNTIQHMVYFIFSTNKQNWGKFAQWVKLKIVV